MIEGSPKQLTPDEVGRLGNEKKFVWVKFGKERVPIFGRFLAGWGVVSFAKKSDGIYNDVTRQVNAGEVWIVDKPEDEKVVPERKIIPFERPKK